MRFAAAAAFAAAFVLAPPALAQSAAEEDVRVNQLVVYGEDPCPESSEDEIIVCARLPDEERYRIPDILRENPNDPASQSWTNKALALEYVGRSGIGSCSPTGPGGMTGCHTDLVRQARAERAGSEAGVWARMIEEARQERLSRIDADAAAAEADAQAAGED